MHPETVLTGHYDYRLVALSVFIATLAAYTALNLAGRVTAATGRLRFVWLSGGAVAMGMGIWSMHYVGMLAYQLPVHVLYDWPTVLWSLLAAVVASAIALFVVSRDAMGLLSIGGGSVLMGIAIASMHYVGMDAMRLQAMCHYSSSIVLLSVVFAIVISMVALWLTFRLRAESQSLGWQKISSTLLMGAAIPAMHYTGMAAVTFMPGPQHGNLNHAVDITSLGVAGIVGVALVILCVAIITSFMDRQLSMQSVQLHMSEQRLRQLVESAQVILWRSGLDITDFGYVSSQAEHILGYSTSRWTGTAGFWLEHIYEEDRTLVESRCRSAVEDADCQFEHRMVAADGRILWFKTSVRVVAGSEKKEMIGVMTDITQRKLAQDEAEAASRIKGDLLGQIEVLNQQLKDENSRMFAELGVTRRLQQMMLPGQEEISQIANLDISCSMDPAAEVGGDYYDVLRKGNSVLFGIGDVTGHGLESGVLALILQTAVRTLLASRRFDSHEYFRILNRVVYDNARRMNCDRNLTLSLMHYEDRTVTISGQHEEVLVLREHGDLERHDTLDLGFPLGLEEKIDAFIGEAKVPLGQGDVMVVYTDGITEAIDPAGKPYGVDRICDVMRATRGQMACGIRDAILNSVRDHIGMQSLFDDMSLLVIRQT